VVRVNGGSFICAPSQGGGRQASNYMRHQGLWVPNGDYNFRFTIQTQNQSYFFTLAPICRRSAWAVRCSAKWARADVAWVQARSGGTVAVHDLLGGRVKGNRGWARMV
jgi:hypothetical protein